MNRKLVREARCSVMEQKLTTLCNIAATALNGSTLNFGRFDAFGLEKLLLHSVASAF
jgi:hypothetical protein